jgi:hypothetical protein
MFCKDSNSNALSTVTSLQFLRTKTAAPVRAAVEGRRRPDPLPRSMLGARHRVTVYQVYSEMAFHMLINSLQPVSAL